MGPPRRCDPRASRDGIQVKAVRGAAGSGIRREMLPRPLDEPLGAPPVPAGGMGERDADLRQPLPQVALRHWARLPARLQDLVGRERTTGCDQCPSRLERLVRRQRLLRDRLDALRAIGQRSAEGVAGPRLTGPATGVAVTWCEQGSHTVRIRVVRRPRPPRLELDQHDWPSRRIRLVLGVLRCQPGDPHAFFVRAGLEHRGEAVHTHPPQR